MSLVKDHSIIPVTIATLNELNHTFSPIPPSKNWLLLEKATQKSRTSEFILLIYRSSTLFTSLIIFSLTNLPYHFLQYSKCSPLPLKLPTFFLSTVSQRTQRSPNENVFNFLLQNLQTYTQILPPFMIEEVSLFQDILPSSALDCFYSHHFKILYHWLSLLFFFNCIFPITIPLIPSSSSSSPPPTHSLYSAIFSHLYLPYYTCFLF